MVSFFLARYLARPIQRIRAAAASFAAGDLSARAGPSLGRRRDEAADLVREFDHMADRVAASGGVLEVRSNGGGGTRVEATLPLRQ